METPPPKYFRLKPGGEVRLKYAYIIKCDEVIKDSSGNVTELRCTRRSREQIGRRDFQPKIKGTIHWVSAPHALDAEVRLYDRLFTVPEPDEGGDFKSFLNPQSLEVVTAKCEPSLGEAQAGAALSIRAPRLFRARSRFAAGSARFQSHHHPARYLGERSEEELIKTSFREGAQKSDLRLTNPGRGCASDQARIGKSETEYRGVVIPTLARLLKTSSGCIKFQNSRTL